MKIQCILITVIGSLVITACNPKQGNTENIPKSPVHTVSWFIAHNAELNNTLKRCNDNPAEFRDQSNCINAQQAAIQRSAGELHPIHIDPENMPTGKSWE